MNATEARQRRGGTTLVERTRRGAPKRAARIDHLVAEASIEHALQRIMEIEHVTAAELARRVKAKPPQISRDLHGGLKKARISRLITLAQALGYDFLPMFIPQGASAERRTLLELYLDVLSKGSKDHEKPLAS